MRGQPRAIYTYTIHKSVIAIVDHDLGRSVTNDADNVVDDLARAGLDLAAYRIIYRDTRGIWDEIVIDRDRFAGFRSINVGSRAEALAKIEAVPAMGGVTCVN